MRVVEHSVKLLFITPNALELIEQAGRTCYKSEDKITPSSSEKFVNMLITKKHESVLEHAYASLRVITDRGVSHEAVRHRIASYSQESTRYCNYNKGKHGSEITVIKPLGLTVEQEVLWREACETSEKIYMQLIDAGVPPQTARYVLPISLKTEFVWTANFREWRTILKQRCSAAAHPHMREIASRIRTILIVMYPPIFEDTLEVK